jgi:hypothetical protein
MRARPTALPAALALLLCAGCGAASSSAGSSAASSSVSPSVSPSAAAPSPGPAVPPVPGIEARAVQLRTDAALGGQVQVRVTDTGTEAFSVTSVAIDSPGFAPLPDREVAAAFTPGRTIDLPTPFGEAVCDRAAEPAAARLTVVRPDGRSEVLRVPLAAEDLTRIHAAACAARAALAVAGVAVTGLAVDGEAVTGSLVLTRGDDDRPVTLTRLEGNVLYDVEADVPLSLAAGEDGLEVPVAFTMASCEPHVLAETKKPFAFLLGMRVGDGDEVPVDLPLDQGQRDVLSALVDVAC